MLEAGVLTFLLVVIVVVMHYEGLLFLRRNVLARRHDRSMMLLLMFAVLLLHMVEIAFYALGYWIGDVVLNVGDFSGRAISFRDYFYFSAETYTTLGLGDIYPLGALRMIASVETLNGILLLGWSTSFSFLAMQRRWAGHDNAPEN